MNNRKKIYAFVTFDNGETIPAAVLATDHSSKTSIFAYGKTYLAHPKAFALDPVNLPLTAGKHITKMGSRNPDGVPGCLDDAGPDDWGKHVLNLLSPEMPVNELDYLVLGSSRGVGCITFSDDPRKLPKPPEDYCFCLDDMESYAMQIDSSPSSVNPKDPLALCFIESSNIGGARPKVIIKDEGKTYIAKFNRHNDRFNNAAAEFCAMKAAKVAGINVADVKLVDSAAGNVLLVERFDTQKTGMHFISYNSLLNESDMKGQLNASYADIGLKTKQLSQDYDQTKEVYRRMLFNIAVGCTDDHTRNHAFVREPGEPKYKLSPAFDIVALPERLGAHQIALGSFGAMPSKDNIDSTKKLLGITDSDAKAIAGQVKDGLETYKKLMTTHLTDKDQQELTRAMQYAGTATKDAPTQVDKPKPKSPGMGMGM